MIVLNRTLIVQEIRLTIDKLNFMKLKKNFAQKNNLSVQWRGSSQNEENVFFFLLCIHQRISDKNTQKAKNLNIKIDPI